MIAHNAENALGRGWASADFRLACLSHAAKEPQPRWLLAKYAPIPAAGTAHACHTWQRWLITGLGGWTPETILIRCRPRPRVSRCLPDDLGYADRRRGLVEEHLTVPILPSDRFCDRPPNATRHYDSRIIHRDTLPRNPLFPHSRLRAYSHHISGMERR